MFPQNPPVFRIGGNNSKLPYQYTMTDLDLKELQDVSNRLTAAMANDPTFAGQVTSDLNLSTPAVNVNIDRDKAAALGISAMQIENALGAAYGGEQVSSIYASSDQYQVILELLPQYQQDASALSRLYVTAQNGTLVPLNAIAHISSGTMPLSINHLGQIPSVTISYNLAPGKALSDAVTAINAPRPAGWDSGDGADQFPGHGAGVPELDAEHGHAAADRDHHGLHHPGHSL